MSRLLPLLSLTLVCFGPAAAQRPDQKAPAKDQGLMYRDKAIRAWVAELTDKDVAVRQATVINLASQMEKGGPPADVGKALSPHLIDRLTDDDATVCRQAALAWLRFNRHSAVREQDAQILTAVLLEALQDPSATVRATAAAGLVRVNPDVKIVLAPIVKLLTDADEDVRSWAASALGETRPNTAAVPALVDALKDKSPRVRRTAANSLSQVGGAAKAAVPGLVAALKDADEWVRKAAAHALGNVRTNPDASIPALIDVLKDGSTAESAAIALEHYGPAAKAAIPALTEAIKSDEEYVRYHALRALSKIDPDGAETISALIEGLKDRADMVQFLATSRLAALGPKAKPAMSALLGLWNEANDDTLRRQAGEAVAKIDAEAARKAGIK